MNMNDNFYGPFFKLCRTMVRMVYPKYTVQTPNLPEGPVVYISHHQNLFGPFISLLWFPKAIHVWMLHVFLDQETCFNQYVDFTFTKRFGWKPWLAKVCAYPVSFFITGLLNSGKGIPVYRGSRKILDTFTKSVDALASGESVVIFPDIDYSDSSSHIKEMYDGFLYLEKYYYKKTGSHVSFVPLYASKQKRLLITGDSISFQDNANFSDERKRVYHSLQSTINQLAKQCGDF